ncbi:hypothetical protein R7035_24735 [Vibrio sp. 1731]|uniref:hypothetical protein n=1 Tax=Vibrio sp. 1731 TaxID=3074573 RepID=UPI0029654134|nr:hypothetical protein [Vibrio sp. 1731]MDW2116723.1 hypothetical protein [Vibrio sp. 1731]
MIWGILIVCIVMVGIVLAAPFSKYLAPGDDIVLAKFNPDTGTHEIIAYGAETLWFQWQSWIYILLFCVAIVYICGFFVSAFRKFSDEAVIKERQKAAQKTEELERLKREFKNQVTQDVQREHREEDERLRRRAHEVGAMLSQAELTRVESEKSLKVANHIVNRQNQETQSKLGQRDRLSEQKKLIVDYLQHSNWQWSDGTKVTYQSLLREAKKSR